MLALFIVAGASWATETGGYVEVRGSWALGVDGVPWQLVERARPELGLDLSDRVRLVTTVEASLTQGRNLQQELERTIDESDLGAMLELAGCEWPEDPRNALFGVSEASDYLRVDRLYVDVYQPKFDLRVGRQSLQWGSAMLIHPTDPFPEVLFVEPWRPRSGVNSARVTVPFGRAHQVQAVVGSDDTFTNARIAGRGTINAADTDFSLVGAYRGESRDGIVGADIKGTLGVGFWLEGAWHFDNEPYEEIALGIDYSFPVLENFLVGVQYYRNGGGTTDPDEYGVTSRTSQGLESPQCEAEETEAMFGAAESDPFAPFTLGTDYAMLQTSLKISSVFTVSGVVLQNVRDGSGIGVPLVQVYPNGWLELAFNAQLPYRLWGRTGEFKPSDAALVMEVPTPVGDLEADLSGMVPDATFIVWTRANF